MNKTEHFFYNLSLLAVTFDINILHNLFELERPVLDNELCGALEQKMSH